jgi:hypothetical protein
LTVLIGGRSWGRTQIDWFTKYVRLSGGAQLEVDAETATMILMRINDDDSARIVV